MSLNRNQMALSVIGGVFGVGAVALGWLLWSALGERSEALEERDNSENAISSFYSAKVFPSAESLDAVENNASEFVKWRAEARTAVEKGDKKYADATPPSFKQFLQTEQVRLSSLPGRVDGKICEPGFAFGFDKYLGQNPTMPAQADLPKLQRQLDFIAESVEMFADAGVGQVKSVVRDDAPVVAAEEERPAPRPSKKGKKGKAVVDDDEPPITSLEYTFTLLASPKALVEVVNKFNSSPTFTVVTEFNFHESRDLIEEYFANREKAENEAKTGNKSGSRRRRGRRGDAEQAEEQDDKPANGGIVIDPEIDAPLDVTLKVKVYDFGAGIVGAAPAAAPQEEEPAAEPAAEAKAEPAAEAPAKPTAAEQAPAAADVEKPAEPAAEANKEAAK